MAYLNDYQYYQNDGNPPEDANWGSYQFVSLADIVNNFLLMYYGNHSLVNNEERYKILFHAKRAIQELNYDAFKEIKALELNVGEQLRFILPQDFVNWVRISLFKDGVLRPLTENIQINTSSAYLQDNDSNLLFDIDGNVLRPEHSTLDFDRIKGIDRTMYMNQGSMFDGLMGYNYNGCWYFDLPVGNHYGLNTETANANPTFNIDKKNGVITFSSNMKEELCILEYITDGMEGGVDSDVTVNKLFEDYVYAYIQYAILNSKQGVQEYIVTRARKNKSSLLRNAKIRMSNIHPGRLLMNMRGKDKWIK
tara:strand:+ start:1265 stop:2188 length:924 start_codon:yes stop_codon:yes gene_type:complete